MMAQALASAIPNSANASTLRSPNARRYKVTIVMPDGSVGEHEGIYADGFEATSHAIESFPQAKRVSAKVVPAWSRRAGT